jgi:hypothetical protein
VTSLNYLILILLFPLILACSNFLSSDNRVLKIDAENYKNLALLSGLSSSSSSSTGSTSSNSSGSYSSGIPINGNQAVEDAV